MDAKIIGTRIKALMTVMNIKRSYLAKALNMSYNTLTKKLNGKREFKIEEILKIKEVFNLDKDLCANIFFSEEFFLTGQNDKKVG